MTTTVEDVATLAFTLLQVDNSYRFGRTTVWFSPVPVSDGDDNSFHSQSGEESNEDKATGEAADATSATPSAATLEGPTDPAQPHDKSTNTTTIANAAAAHRHEGQVICIAVMNPSRVRSVYEEVETDVDSEFDIVSHPESQHKTAKATVPCLRKWGSRSGYAKVAMPHAT
jgi:hypothetical protein